MRRIEVLIINGYLKTFAVRTRDVRKSIKKARGKNLETGAMNK